MTAPDQGDSPSALEFASPSIPGARDVSAGRAWAGSNLLQLLDRAAVRKSLLSALCCCGFLTSLLFNWPGHFEPDSLWQLAQGRTGVFNSWHPPVMAWLLGVAERVSHGAPLFFAADCFLFYGSLLALSLLSRRPRLISLPVTALLCASPLALIYQGVVWKDVLFADSALAGFAALGFAARLWGRPSARLLLSVLAFLLFSLAALTRQNGLVVPLCGAVALGVIVWSSEARTSITRALPIRPVISSAAAFLASLLAIVSAGSLLEARSDHVPENLHQMKRLQVYDVAGMVHFNPHLALPELYERAPDLEEFIRTEAAPHFRRGSADNLEQLPGADTHFIPEGNAISAQWLSLIVHHPLLYLRERFDVFYATLATPHEDVCPTVFVGIDGEQPGLDRDAGLTPRYSAQDAFDDKYATAFVGTPVFSHVASGALVLLSLALCLWRISRGEARPEVFAVMGLGCAAFLFAASFFVISMACDYRYLYFLDVAAMGSLAFHASWRGGRSRSSGARSAPSSLPWGSHAPEPGSNSQQPFNNRDLL